MMTVVNRCQPWLQGALITLHFLVIFGFNFFRRLNLREIIIHAIWFFPASALFLAVSQQFDPIPN
jgi:hypothetical protein